MDAIDWTVQQALAMEVGSLWPVKEGGAPERIPDWKRLEILHLLGEGVSEADIADRCDVSRSAVYRIAKQQQELDDD